MKALLAGGITVPPRPVFLVSRNIGVKQEGRAQEKMGQAKKKLK